MSDKTAQVDQHGLTPADYDAIVEWWRGTQHRGVYYQQPRIKNRQPRNSFTLPDDVVNALGAGDPKAAGAVLHGMFGLRPYTGEDDPRVIDPDVVKHIGHGSISAGQRVLRRFVSIVRHREREGVILEHDRSRLDNDHGWRIVRK